MSYYNYNLPQEYVPPGNPPPTIPPISSLDPTQLYDDAKPFYRPQLMYDHPFPPSQLTGMPPPALVQTLGQQGLLGLGGMAANHTASQPQTTPAPTQSQQPQVDHHHSHHPGLQPLGLHAPQHQVSWPVAPIDHQYLAPPAAQAAPYLAYQYPGIPYYPYMLHMYRSPSSPRQHLALRAPGPPLPARVKSELLPVPHDGTFKPKNTKRNSRPRVHKLSGDFRDRARKQNCTGQVREPSIDDMTRHFQEVLAIEVPELRCFSLQVDNKFEARLLDLFANNLTRSLDIFLPCDMFRLIVPHLALYDDTHMVLDSIYCLALMILYRIDHDAVDPSITINYYQRCIKLIRHHLSAPGVETNDLGIIARCLLSTIVLCVYELFLVAEDATYIKGAASIFLLVLRKNTQAQKPSLLKLSPFYEGLFWAMVLSDMILSLKYDLPTMYPIDTFWRPLDPEYFEWFESITFPGRSEFESVLSRDEEVWWIRKMIYLLCCIHDFLFQPTVQTRKDAESERNTQRWLELTQSLNDFEASLPVTMKPAIYKPTSSSRRYPIIFFGNEGAAIVNLNFKLCKIALYQAFRTRIGEDPMLTCHIRNYAPDYATKLAKDIIGILKTYDSNVLVWPVNVHAIRQAAKYMKDDPEDMKVLGDLISKVLAVCHLQYKKT